MPRVVDVLGEEHLRRRPAPARPLLLKQVLVAVGDRRRVGHATCAGTDEDDACIELHLLAHRHRCHRRASAVELRPAKLLSRFTPPRISASATRAGAAEGGRDWVLHQGCLSPESTAGQPRPDLNLATTSAAACCGASMRTALTHTAPCCELFLLPRNFALRARGLRSISCSPATIGFFVSTSYSPSFAPSRNASFTSRSSSEWKLMQTTRPPGFNRDPALRSSD